jgi:hypothetical protein
LWAVRVELWAVRVELLAVRVELWAVRFERLMYITAVPDCTVCYGEVGNKTVDCILVGR